MKAIFLRAPWYFSPSRQSFFSWLVLGSLAIGAHTEPFIAYVDKTEIRAGESFRLTLEYQDQTSEQPDFSPLEQDFTILSQKTSAQTTYVNGAYQGKTRFILEIEPKNEKKELMIPSIKLGKYMTSPIQVMQSNKPAASPSNSKEIALLVTVDRPEVYVNGEVILHIEIKTPLSLQNGTINKPEIADAIMETLAEDNLRETVEDGIKYFVFTRSYAIFPSKPGTLVIPPLTFKGVAADLRVKSDPLSGFFSSGKRVSSRSSPIKVTVKDVPAGFPKDEPFLPLKSFLVIESFDDADAKFAVNKATTRRFEIKAKGTLASNLPTIAVPAVENMQIYAETGNKIQKNADGDFESSVKFSHVYMPTAPGKVKVPEQVIHWWDVDADQLRTATIRALDLDIVGGAPPLADKEVEPKESPLPETPSPSQAQKESATQPVIFGLWQLLALLFLLLWLLTMALFFWRSKKTKTAPDDEAGYEKTLRSHIKNIVQACDAADPKTAYRALQSFREWAKRHNALEWFDNAVGEKQRELEIALFEKGQPVDSKKTVLLELKNHVRNLKVAPPHKPQLLPLYRNKKSGAHSAYYRQVKWHFLHRDSFIKG